MNLDKFKKRIAEIKNLKSKRKMRDLNLSDLQELPIINGALETVVNPDKENNKSFLKEYLLSPANRSGAI